MTQRNVKFEKNGQKMHFQVIEISMKTARALQNFRHFLYLQTWSDQKISKTHGDISL